jgi:hypothetical protein
MKLILKMVFVIALVVGLFGCGGGGGGGAGGAATTNADFTGTWSGVSGSTALTFQISQTGNVLSLTRLVPADPAITYTGTVSGDTGSVTTFINGVAAGSSTFTKTNGTTINSVVTSCNPPAGYTCAPAGSTVVFTKAVSSAASFPLQTGYRALVANGLLKSFTISGTCSGSGHKASSPANTATTFEGISGFSSTTTTTLTFTNCTPATSATTSTSYVDSNYVPLGFNSIGVNYGVYLSPPAIPTTVTVGSTGTVGTETLYTSSSKATPNGTIVSSYVVEPGTASTAIVNLIGKIYDAGGTLTATEQDRYRIDTTGTLTPTTVDIQYTNGSTTHLVLAFN